MTTREERERLLAEAMLNPFRLRAEDVLLDFLTDASRPGGAAVEPVVHPKDARVPALRSEPEF